MSFWDNLKSHNKQGCLSGVGPDLCLICKQGLPNASHKCNTKSTCSLKHCSICQFGLYYEEICFKCQNGYINTELGCIRHSKFSKIIKGCARYRGTLDRCQRCKVGYYIGPKGTCKRNKIHVTLSSIRRKHGLSSGIRLLDYLMVVVSGLLILG